MTDWLLLLSTIATALSTLAGVAILLARQTRRIDNNLSRWYGRDAAPGFPRIPGIPERVEATEHATQRIEAEQKRQATLLETIHQEVTPNSGGSLKDQVGRVDRGMASLAARMDASERDRRALHDADAALLEGQKRIVSHIDMLHPHVKED